MTATREYHQRPGSLSRRAGEDAERASASLARRQDRFTFRSLARALGWFFVTREKLTGAMSPKISAENIDRVEGGTGSSIEEAQANLSTIRQGMEALLRSHGTWTVELVEARYRDGMSVEKIADREKKSAHTISVHLGKAEGFLSGWLYNAAVLG